MIKACQGERPIRIDEHREEGRGPTSPELRRRDHHADQLAQLLGRETLESLEGTTTTYERCVVAAGSDAVAVDTFARYTRPDGMTAVASCDIYEFSGDKITAITSYAVEVDPEDAGSQPPPRV